MQNENLLKSIKKWFDKEQHEKILDAILALPKENQDDELLGQLAVAYNNLEEYDKAIAVLEQLRPRQEHTPKWQFRMGYALYYSDEYEKAKAAFSRCLILNPPEDYIKDCQDFLEMIEKDRKQDEEYLTHPKEYVQPEMYEDAQWNAVEAHITKYFGKYPNVFHEILSPDIHVDICIIPPSKDRDYYTLVTMGMGAHRMNVPPELADKKLERAEMVIALPPHWKVGENDEIWYWPIRLLKQLARLPGECNTWLGWGHTVDNQEPYAENTHLWGSILINPINAEDKAPVCPLPDGDEVNFYQVIPIYREEMEYKQANNAKMLFEYMEDIPFVVDPNRPNYCEDSGDLSDILMDSATLHLYSLREKQLPVEEIAAYNHLAIYLRWCIEQNLMSDLFIQRLPELIEDVKQGYFAIDLREQLRDREELNHELLRPYFNDAGESFAAYYYKGEDQNAPYYPADVDDYAKSYFGETQYHSEEFQDEAYLFVPYDEAYYQGMKQYLDRRWNTWQSNVQSGNEVSIPPEEDLDEPSELSQALMHFLDCPCTYLAPTLDDDDIVAAYTASAERGKKEGFIPMLVAEDETLWECLLMNSAEESDYEEDYGFDAKKVATYRKNMLETPLPQGKDVTALMIKTRLEEAEEDDMSWDQEVLGQMSDGEAHNQFLGYWNYSTKYTIPLILAEIPVKNPWEIFAYLPFGGWNECPDTLELMAVTKYWFELYGAVPAVMTHDTLEFSLPAPIKPEQALQLAREQYAWCPDVVDQGGDDATVGTLANGLCNWKNWYFWWD